MFYGEQKKSGSDTRARASFGLEWYVGDVTLHSSAHSASVTVGTPMTVPRAGPHTLFPPTWTLRIKLLRSHDRGSNTCLEN